MGCVSKFGRCILVLLNLLIVLAALALVAVGVLMMKFTNVLATLLLNFESDSLNSTTVESFHLLSDVSQLTEMPFLVDLGLVLVIFGCVILVISFAACCGSCCAWRPLLYTFVILMTILVIAQVTVGTMIFIKDSSIHQTIENSLEDKINKDYKYTEDDAFSWSINLLNYELECCGIKGSDTEFPDYKPASCCNRTIITGDSSWDSYRQACTSDPPSAPPEYYNQKGCYQVVQDLILSDVTYSAVVFAGIEVIQLCEIVFAVLVIREINERNTKVASMRSY